MPLIAFASYLEKVANLELSLLPSVQFLVIEIGLSFQGAPEMDTGHFFGPGSDPTHKRPTCDSTRPAKIVYNLTRDPTRLHANALRYITDYIFYNKKQHCAKY